MKKLVALLLVFSLLGPASAFCKDRSQVYYLDSAGMSITISDEYYVLTHNKDTNDSTILTLLGFTQDTFEAYLDSFNAYLLAIAKGLDCMIVISLEPSQYATVDKSQIKRVTDELFEEFSEGSMNAIYTDVYYQDLLTFFVVNYTNTVEDTTQHILQYFTFYDYKGINVMLMSMLGPVTTEHEIKLQQMLNTIRFDSQDLARISVTETSSFTYITTNTPASIKVPSNWLENQSEKYKTSSIVTFVPDNDARTKCKLASVDYWTEGLSVADRNKLAYYGFDRDDFDMAIASVFLNLPAQLPEWYGNQISVDDIQEIRYGKNDYFVFKTKSKMAIGGINIDKEVTTALTYQNGYMYTFEFSSILSNPPYADFESILSSLTVD